VVLLALLPLLLIGEGLLPGRVVSAAGLERKAPWRSTSTSAELALPQMNADLVREKFSFEPFARAAMRDGNIPWWSPYQNRLYRELSAFRMTAESVTPAAQQGPAGQRSRVLPFESG